MTEKSNMTKCLLHSIGLNLLIHPNLSDTWTPGYILGGYEDKPFATSEVSTGIRIRIFCDVKNESLKSAGVPLRSYKRKKPFNDDEFYIIESMLTDIHCFNSTLRGIEPADEPSFQLKPKQLEIDFTAPQSFNELTEKLECVFHEDFYWTGLSIPSDIISSNAIYFSALAVLIVDSISSITEQYERLQVIKFKLLLLI